MAQLVLATAGAVIGGAIGGPAGAKWGWMIGSAAGGILFPPKQPDGPRLEDLTVQVSTYGAPIARTWGMNRLTGNVIWASEMTEHAEEQGGKGGSSYSTYSYSCSFAVAICEGPIAGITRIWADGRLIFDGRPENTGKQKDFEAVSLVSYLGTEDQEPDATMQALQGDVPAYRGLAYVVFNELQLERYGNRIPNLSFEVVTDGTIALEPPEQFGERYSWGGGVTFESDMTTDGKFWVGTRSGHAVQDSDGVWSMDANAPDGAFQVQRYDPETLEIEFAVDASAYSMAGAGAAYGTSFYMGRGQPGSARAGFISCGPPSFDYCYGLPNPYSHGIGVSADGVVTDYIDSASSSQFQNAIYWPGAPYFTPDNAGVTGMSSASSSLPRVSWWSSNGLLSNGGVRFLITGEQDREAVSCACGPIPPNFDGVWTSGGGSWSFKSTTTSDGYSVIQGWSGVSASWLFDGRTEVGYSLPGSGVSMPAIVIDEARGNVYAWANAEQIALYRDGAATGFEFDGTASEWAVRAATIDQDTGLHRLLVGGGLSSPPALVLFNPDTEVVVERLELVSLDIADTQGKLWDFPERGAVLYSDGYANYWIPYAPRLTGECVPLSEIVTDLSIASGLTADDIDVTELTDCVLGYLIARPGTARSAIEQLMIAYGFDAVQSGLKIKYVKRGKTPVATIPQDDLAAHESGDDVPEPLPLTRSDDVALPNTVTIKYIDQAADYQTGVQSSARQTGRARSEISVDLPVVLTGAHAKAVADQAMYSGWIARTKTQFSTTIEYLRLEPTDVVTVNGSSLYLTKRTVNGGLLNFEAEFDAGLAMIGGAVAGVGTGQPVQVINTVPASFLLLLDGPLLRDADDDPGSYYAVYGATGGGTWRGANVEASLSGSSWSTVATVNSPGSTVGTTTDALDNWTGGWIFDEISRVTVTMQSGTLESKLRAEVLAGQNRALIGADGRWECIHYRTATFNLDGTYTLSGLLRGRHGTEWAMGTHAVGDRFIAMPASTLLTREIDNADLGVSYQYRAVTLGGTRASAVVSAFTIDGERLKPWAPVDLRRSRDGSDNLTLTWKRRTRLSTRFTGGAGINTPLGETSEAYEVDIYDDNTYTTMVRTITGLATATATYSAANQTTDFGSPQAQIFLRVYQVSATVGRGHYLQGAA
jgi:Putative phage tail protein